MHLSLSQDQTVITQQRAITGPDQVPLWTQAHYSLARMDHASGPPTLLFTHGFLQSLSAFEEQLPLAQELPVLLWDLPDHGRSASRVTDVLPSLHHYAEAFHTLVEQFHLRETGYVPVLWSFGGLLFQAYLHRYGEHALEGVRGVIFVNSLLDPTTLRTVLSTETAPFMAQLYATDWHQRIFGLSAFVQALSCKPLARAQEERRLGYTLDALLRLPPVGVQEDPRFQFAGDSAQLLQQIAVPALVIHGTEDALLPPVCAQALADRLPRAQLVCFDGCGHSPFLEAPERFNQAVLAFARALQGPGGTFSASALSLSAQQTVPWNPRTRPALFTHGGSEHTVDRGLYSHMSRERAQP